ncbi:SDR family NAD(P)-dependent oxidoreductase [Nitrospira sp. M1]
MLTQPPTHIVRPSRQQTVFVAGGSGVIGQAICRCFGQHQWQVGIHYHCNHESAEQISQAVHTAGGTATLYQANVQDHAHTRTMMQHFVEKHEQLDVLVWAVGIAESHLLARTSTESWTKHITTNLTGCFQLLKAAAPTFERQQHGSVVLIGSLSGVLGTSGQTAYATSKAGLMGLMKSVAREWAPWNIRVNAVFPGWHTSPLARAAYSHERIRDTHLLNNTPNTENVANMIYEVALTENLSGQIWNLDSRIW